MKGRAESFAAVRILVTSNDCEISVSDGGRGFDLESELRPMRSVASKHSVPHGLSAIYKIAADIEQEKTFRGHRDKPGSADEGGIL